MGIIRDPRVMQIILLGIYTLAGVFLLDFSVTWIQIGLTLLLCTILELLLVYWKKGTLVWPPYSAVITGLGIALALRGDTVIPFIIAALVAIGLKHFVRYRGNHIFNPSNSGIVAVTLLIPSTATAPLQWGYFLWILALMSIGGLYLVFKVHRQTLVFSFFLSFIAIQYSRHLIWPEQWNANFSAFMWGGLFVFMFNMITDPKTSPKSIKSQLVFGVSTAVIAQIMIHLNVHNAVFISLAIVTLGRFLIIWIEDNVLNKNQTSVKHSC
ncbi:RnfABCDGE type electron transport complex subunit D [Aquibacillus salsiterrae]|uniref:RnfABCDGE type electron transport complex subunit D n=1 Tax=Aquibacillus salsiterrae TaxID=2950439 RepID=A0A9X4AHF6_9BACI|nr:RnfABCDGE type electron transport complex subunit D [Aquibacillus salsiterrae]MDC3418148.1 RnfABCDGE type electron transport complex subunit D [Aquibacillus salsiterrae]